MKLLQWGTLAVISLTGVGALAAQRTAKRGNHNAMEVAIDIVLEPDDVMATRAKQINQRLIGSYPDGFALDDDHIPHLTLLQGFVPAAQLANVEAAVQAAAKGSPIDTWRAQANDIKEAPWGKGLSMVSIDLEHQQQIASLQSRVVAAVAPFLVPSGNASAFFTDARSPTVDPTTITYVAEFVSQHSGDNFNPHVTAGVAHPGTAEQLKKTFTPFEFGFRGIAIYQLGDDCTARKKI